MKDEPLKKRLREWRPPAAGGQARDRALHRALLALGQPDRVETSPGKWPWREMAAGLALVVLCVGLWPLLHRAGPHLPLAEARQMLEQMNALFPGRINAVISHRQKVDLELGVGPSEQPVVIQFRRGREVTRVLSYSGRTVCLELAGKKTCFEVLVGGDDRIIIAGKDFLWDGRNSAPLDGFRVEAFSLEPAS